MKKLTYGDFLKKYTAIDNKFIDQYISFYDISKKNKYAISLDSIIDFLKIKNKRAFCKDFLKTYKLNKDYIIKKNICYTSLDTFDKICMAVDNKQGDQVREFFILHMRFIDYYKDDLKDMLDK